MDIFDSQGDVYLSISGCNSTADTEGEELFDNDG